MACDLNRPELDEPAAHEQAARQRTEHAPFVEVFRCPVGKEDHWHVTTWADDPILPLARARAAQTERSAGMDRSIRRLG